MEKYADSIYDESNASQMLKQAIAAQKAALQSSLASAEYPLKDGYASHPNRHAPISQDHVRGLVAPNSRNVHPLSKELLAPPPSSWLLSGLNSRVPTSSAAVAQRHEAGVDHDTEDATRDGGTMDGTVVTAKNPIVDGAPPSLTFPETSQRTKTKNGQIPSPTPTPPSPRGSKRKAVNHRRQRSLSPMSDDSFAGPLPRELDHKRYIATTKAFQIPLSQLGRSSESSIDQSIRRDDDALSDASTEDMDRALPGYQSDTRSSRVLAPSSEPSESQPEDESFPVPQAQTVDGDDDEGQARTQHSMWFPSSAEAERVMQKYQEDNHGGAELSKDHSQGSGASQEVGNQVSTQPATPIATQPDDYIPVEELPVQQTGASNATSGARSMVSLVDPRKAYRYKAALELAQSRPPRLHGSRPQTVPEDSVYEETQPSTSSRLPATGRLLTPPRLPSPPPAAFPSDIEETQPSTSANLPATGFLLPQVSPFSLPSNHPHPSPYEATQPSDDSGLPPTAERIEQELLRSPAVWPQHSRHNVFSNLAHSSSMDIIPDSEATQPDLLRGPTMSPVIPSPVPTPVQPPNPPSKSAVPSAPNHNRRFAPPQPGSEVIPDSMPSNTSRALSRTESHKGKNKESARGTVERDEDEEEEAQEEPVPKEEEEEDEEEVPLAKVESSRPKRGQAATRGRGSSKSMMPPPPMKKKATAPAPRSTRSSRKAGTQSNTASEIVPSSIPLENLPQPVDPPPDPPKPQRGKGSAGKSTTRSKGKKASKPVTPVREVSEDLSEPESDEDLLTELADDDAMTVEDELPGPTNATRKRKRETRAMSVRSSTRSVKMTRAATITPVNTRPAKRSRMESLEQIKTSGATRVLALWKSDNFYYTGTVYSTITSNRYLVRFDDSEEAEVELHQMRSCTFRKDDRARFIPSADNGQVTVVDTARISEGTVTVNDGERNFEAQLSDLKVYNLTVSRLWTDRLLTPDAIDPYEKPHSVKVSSSSSTSVLGNQTGQKGRRLLSRIGFAVTLSGNEELRTSLGRIIENNGGTIIDDWGKLFTMKGAHAQQGKQWKIYEQDVKWVGGELEKVFLLADSYNQKPKYLMALALGIPCLDVAWLKESVEEGSKKAWQPYLLAGGVSDRLGTHVSQMVDFNWGEDVAHLEHIMDNHVAAKVFAGKSILCISPDFVPERLKRGSTDSVGRDADSKRMIPRIILCMGATAVEAVIDVRYASTARLDEYDYIVIEPEAYPEITDRVKNLQHCVPFTWVKECLISGRLLPMDSL